jgi:PPM family protein phosphatase
MAIPQDAAARIETDLGLLAGVTDRGFGHERNEDAMALGRGPDGTMAAVVCDGVSTSFMPERAARTAADTALDVLLTSTCEGTARVRTAIAAAASSVAALGGEDRRSPSCTLVCALVRPLTDPAEVTVGWVGDSRAYWLAGAGAARLLTTDHSWAAEMVAAGVLDEATAMRSPRAHAITRWLGSNGDSDPEIATLRPSDRGAVLLCTDGLWNYVPDPADLADIALAALAERGPIKAADALTAVALDAGGRDNITVVVIPT